MPSVLKYPFLNVRNAIHSNQSRGQCSCLRECFLTLGCVAGLMYREIVQQAFLPGSKVYWCWHWFSGFIAKGWAPNIVGHHLLYPVNFPATSKFFRPPCKVFYKFWADSYRYACTHGYRLCYIAADVRMCAQMLVLCVAFPLLWEGPSPSPQHHGTSGQLYPPGGVEKGHKSPRCCKACWASAFLFSVGWNLSEG